MRTSHSAWLTVIACLATLLLCVAAQGAPRARGLGDLPFRFEENVGQTDPKVEYVARGSRYRVFVTRTGATIALDGRDGTAAIELALDGASEAAAVTGEARLASHSRYLGAKELLAPHFGRVRLAAVYPGVDWVFYGNPDRLEHDFVVAPSANPAAIRMKLAGADALTLDPSGDLVVETASGELRMLAPVAYQEVDGRREPVEIAFALDGATVAFRLGAYDREKQLVIDPVLSYATYLGGHGAEVSAAIAVNAEGEAHVVGSTRSLDFPATPGAAQEDYAAGSCSGGIVNTPCFDVVAAKLNARGTDLLYATYFGGAGNDLAADAALGADGSLYITGTTDSRDFPVSPGAAKTDFVDSTARRGDAFLVRLGPSGARIFATLIGGSDAESGAGVTALEDGAAVVGITHSTDLPVAPDAFQPTKAGGEGAADGFVAIVDATGGRIEATYLGGGRAERMGDVAASSGRALYVTGSTASADFPLTDDAWQPRIAGEADAFFAVLEGVEAVRYATFFGGAGVDTGKRITLDSRDRAYVLGSTDSRDLPTSRTAVLPVWKRSQGFLARFSAFGEAPDYATYVVGSADHVAVDDDFNAYVAGQTTSSLPVFGGAVLPGCNGSLLRKIGPEGARMLYSGFVPGLGAIDVDAGGFVYSAGVDAAGDLETTAAAPQPEHAGQSDLYVQKFAIGDEPDVSITCVEHGASFYPGGAAPGQILTVFGSGLGPLNPLGLRVENGRVVTELGGVRVLFDGTPAPLLFVWWNQLNVVVPYAVEGKDAVRLVVERDGIESEAFELPIAPAHPGLFTRNSTGAGLGAILNQDGSINTVDNPASAGDVITLYGTGEGQTDPPGVDGLVAGETLESLPRPTLPVQVAVGETDAEVLYVGQAPTFVSGVLQINVKLPASTPSGEAPLRVTIGGRFNRQPVFVQVQ